MIGTKESARFNAVLVAVKVTALTLFIALPIPMMKGANFDPFVPNGWGSVGVVGAAASIFFAYLGFDPVSTEAAETRNPQPNVTIGPRASLGPCNDFYLLVPAGRIGLCGT